MKRTDREITDRTEIDSILQVLMICRIGLADGGEPYIVPLSFGYADGAIYLHSAMAGKKISMLKKNSRCCFEVVLCNTILCGDRPCA